MQPRRQAAGAALAIGMLLGAVGASGCGAGTPGPNPTTAKADIGRVYGVVFDFTDRSVPRKTAVIEDGASLTAAITQALGSSLAAAAAGARVDSVTLLGSSACAAKAVRSPCAEVTYDILGSGGSPLFATPSAGYAVFVGGRWLMAKATICGLLELFYSVSGHQGTPPGC